MVERAEIVSKIAGVKGHTWAQEETPSDDERWTGRQYGASFEVVKPRGIVFEDQGETSTLVLTLKGKALGRDKLRQEFVDVLGEPAIEIQADRFVSHRLVWNDAEADSSSSGEEAERPTGELQITMSGGADVYRWMKAVSVLESKGIAQNVPNSLPLGTHAFSNAGSIEGYGGGIGVDIENHRFDLQAQLYLPPESSTAIVAMGNGAMSISMADIMKARSKTIEDVIDWEKFVSNLQKKAEPDGFEVNPAEGRPGVEVVIGADSYELSPTFGQMKESVILISSIDSLDIEEERFVEKYSNLAEVTKLVVNAVSETFEKPAPVESFEIKPPRNIVAQAESFERAAQLEAQMAGAMNEDKLSENLRNRIKVERPDIRFADIAGLEKQKDALQVIVESLQFPEIFEEEGAQPPKGVLLYGEPGVGKTTLVKAVAGEANVQFLSIKLSDVMHHFMGVSEKLITESFKIAAEEAPCIMFIDELDAIASNRNTAQHEMTSKMVSSLISSMDWLDEQGVNVTVVAATNRKDDIDPALTRAGRMDIIMEVPKPNDEGRIQGFQIKMAAGEERAKKQIFDEGIDMKTLADMTRGMTVADIEEVIRRILVGNARTRIAGREVEIVTTDRIVDEISKYEISERTKKPIVAWGQRQS